MRIKRKFSHSNSLTNFLEVVKYSFEKQDKIIFLKGKFSRRENSQEKCFSFSKKIEQVEKGNEKISSGRIILREEENSFIKMREERNFFFYVFEIFTWLKVFFL